MTTPIRDVINRPDVLALFTHQHFVATCAQLVELGLTRQAVHKARQRGVVVAPLRGVLALAGVELSFEGRVLALQLTAGPTAFVSGPSAGVLYGLRSMPRDRLEVTIKESRRATIPAPHRLVRTSWIKEPRDVRVRPDGIRIATPLRMLFGLAEQFNQHRFERAAEDVWHKGLVAPDEAADYLAAIRRSGRSGVSTYEAWLERLSFHTRPAQSGLEVRLLELIERVGLPAPERQFPLLLANGELVHLDIAWPAARLAVEPGHSWWHGGDLRQRHDQARDRACAVVGWHVVRYDETAAEDPMATARELGALYRRRIADLTGSSETLSTRG